MKKSMKLLYKLSGRICCKTTGPIKTPNCRNSVAFHERYSNTPLQIRGKSAFMITRQSHMYPFTTSLSARSKRTPSSGGDSIHKEISFRVNAYSRRGSREPCQLVEVRRVISDWLGVHGNLNPLWEHCLSEER